MLFATEPPGELRDCKVGGDYGPCSKHGPFFNLVGTNHLGLRSNQVDDKNVKLYLNFSAYTLRVDPLRPSDPPISLLRPQSTAAPCP